MNPLVYHWGLSRFRPFMCMRCRGWGRATLPVDLEPSSAFVFSVYPVSLSDQSNEICFLTERAGNDSSNVARAKPCLRANATR